jgi:hypothetical protein
LALKQYNSLTQPRVKDGIVEIDRNAPSTEGDLMDLEERSTNRFDGKLDGQEQRILDTMQAMIHDSETRLLGAFYSFAEGN